MTRLALIIALFGLMGALSSALSADKKERAAPFKVKNPARAEFNWMMNCQGCHGVNGEGSLGGAPPMRGVVARFLEVDGGREYLGRVPGVVNAPLNNEELSDVLNLMLARFACNEVVAGFAPYDPQEVAELRDNSLITGADEERKRLLAALASLEGNARNSEADAFATSGNGNCERHS